MRRLILLVPFALSLAACATTATSDGDGSMRPPPAGAPPGSFRADPEAAPGASSAPILYACAGGKRFTAAWGLPGDKVKVTAGGVARTLPAAPSASGARYSDGTFEIWGKGEEAMLNGFPGGPYRSCRTD